MNVILRTMKVSYIDYFGHFQYTTVEKIVQLDECILEEWFDSNLINPNPKTWTQDERFLFLLTWG